MTKPMLTEDDYAWAAEYLGCEVAAIKAVASVESTGSGFLPTGEPKILFEAHHFDRLTAGRYRTSHPNLSSPRWNRDLYGAPGAHQHRRLQRAVALDRDAALMSASWGKFQVMGFNWKMVGRASLQSFVNAQYRSEGEHLRDFVGYVVARRLDDELRRKDWAGFARGYNGPAFAQHGYDVRMASEYKRIKGAE